MSSSLSLRRLRPPDPLYPDSDGQPMAENTVQYEWIVTIKGGLDDLFRDRPDVFVAGDLLWYPVKGEPTTRVAPDALVAFGRPKGHRGSYKQWEEDGIAPQVVFEVLSPGNRPGAMGLKRQFYEDHGVEEYYIYDPEPGVNALDGYLRDDSGRLVPVPVMDGWTSPLLGIRFERTPDTLHIIRPDGRRFVTFQEQADLAREVAEERDEAERRAEDERRRAEDAARRVEALSEERDAERRRAEEAVRRAEELAAKLRALGIDPAD